ASELSKFIQIIAKQNGRLEILHGMKETLLSISTSPDAGDFVITPLNPAKNCLISPVIARSKKKSKGVIKGIFIL
ncbi:MAG: hypothetical protein ACP5JR_06810, partial [Thermoplasmata archaeon]